MCVHIDQLLSSNVRPPWGQVPNPEIPVPPFAPGEHTAFVQALIAHIEELEGASDSLAASRLVSALRTQATDGPELTTLEFDTASSTFFPAPWTPEAFAAAIEAVRPHPWNPEVVAYAWTWGFEPVETASPDERGGWNITSNERGNIHRSRLRHRGDLVLRWMHSYARPPRV